MAGHIAQQRYSTLVDLKLRASLVQKDGVVWNNRYEGSPKAGVVKVPVRDTEVSVSAYNKKTGAEQTHGDTNYIDVIINKDYAVNEIIDGFDEISVPDNIVADRIDSAAVSLALQMNIDSTEALMNGGIQTGTTVALTKDTVYKAFVDTRTAMSKNKIPASERFVLVSPETYALLLLSPEFVKATDLGDAVVQTGAVGRIAGFTVYEDVTLPEKVEFIAGHPAWCARIKEWMVDVHVQDLSQSGIFIGATSVQGRQIYAHKVTKSAAVLIKKTT